jgi:GAF domain-containing protein
MWRLLDVARSVLAEPDPEVIYERIVAAARELTGARYAALGVLDEQRTKLERLHVGGMDEATRRAIGELPRGRGVLGLLISDPRPLRINDLARHPARYGFPPSHPVMHNFLGVPVLIDGEVCGSFYLAEKDGDFNDLDEEVALIIADWAAVTVSLARSQPPAARRWRDREPANADGAK